MLRYKEHPIDELFTPSNGDFDIQQKHINGKGEIVVSSGKTNNGIIGRTNVVAKVFDANTITIDMFGNMQFRGYKYKMVTHARVFSLDLQKRKMTKETGLYIASSLQYIQHMFSYNKMANWNEIKNKNILLPVNSNDEIDFKFMENYIREIERARIRELTAYLKVAGLTDCNFTEDEKVMNRGG